MHAVPHGAECGNENSHQQSLRQALRKDVIRRYSASRSEDEERHSEQLRK